MVDRCICSHISLKDILAEADSRGGATLRELQEARVCSVHCELCVPYVKAALRTGKTAFIPGGYILADDHDSDQPSRREPVIGSESEHAPSGTKKSEAG